MHPFHPEYILTAFIQIVPFIGVTLLMMAGTVLFGGLIGILLAKAKMNRRMVPRAIAVIYIYLTRCIPSIVMLFLVYYGVPVFLSQFGIDVNHLSKGVFVITAFFSAVCLQSRGGVSGSVPCSGSGTERGRGQRWSL